MKREGEQDSEFLYEVCPFDSIKQTDIYGTVYNLGTWNEVSSATKEGESMKFINGDGPCRYNAYRNSQIIFTCGSSTKITEALEPTRCQYTFKMTVHCNEESHTYSYDTYSTSDNLQPFWPDWNDSYAHYYEHEEPVPPPINLHGE